jgi:DNA-directed RNA polymerase II subunit RPB2
VIGDKQIQDLIIYD